MIIRAATEADAPGILEIHSAAVATSTAIWTDQPVDLADRQAYLADHDAAGHAVLVAAQDEVIVGYASFGTWRQKNGYRLTVDDSVYVREGHQGAGIGKALLSELISIARGRGFHVMIADIESGNTGSIRLHEQFGFVTCGNLSQVGTKFGRWLDLTIMQLELNPGTEPPQPGSA